MIDLLITNGTIHDGTGAPPYRAAIAVKDGKIVDVIREQAAVQMPQASTTVDASGRIVTPGFVDVHSHSDITILANPEGESKLRQGITTEIVGNCGYSAFPLRGALLDEERESNAKLGVNVTWQKASQYFDVLERAKPAFNMATFVGHGNIRASVMGYDDRPASVDDMNAMKREIDEAMDEGCLGMSTGLIYSPGMFAETGELVELQKAAKARGGMYASHVRGEGDTLSEAADEFMAVVEGAQCQGQFSHLKASGPRNWGKVKRVVDQIEAINRNGGNVKFDKYPYVASSTELVSILPRWCRSGGREQTLEKLADATLRDRIIRESEHINEGKDGWASVLICEAGAEEFVKYQGKRVSDVASDLGMSGGEAFITLLVASRLTTSICNFTMSQDETDMVILHPNGMICTDASCRAPYGPLSESLPHPRAYGTFARFFRDYVKERKLITLEEAIRKVTSLPCETFNLKHRGTIQQGNYADLLVIDWDAYRDRADFADPHHYCEGLDAIIVNGVLTVQHGKQTGNRAGMVLRRA